MSESPSSALRSQRGAVNALWLIVIVILWVATLFVLYVTSADVAQFQEDARAARAAEQAMSARADEVRNELRSLSEVVGYRDASVFGSTSDLTSVRAEITGVKGVLGAALGGADTQVTVDQTIKALTSAYQASRAAEQAAKTDFESERKARAAAEAKLTDIEGTYRNEVASLQRQLSEEQARADTQAQNDKRRIDQITADNESANAAAQEAQRTLEDSQSQARKEVAALNATIKALEPRRQPVEPESPDGALLAVSGDATVAWIDIGGRDGLRRGTRFELLRRSKGGELVPRGKVEVRDVSSDMAMVGLLGKADPFDPMLAGDLVRNPHFAKGESLHFYLLGDFPLTLSKEFVGERLAELGSTVDAQLGVTTDVLVLGEPSLADESARPLTESEEYLQADKLGMRIVRLDELAGFLRY